MQRHDSEPLFGEEVYQFLRDDSLLHRTGSNNFADLIDHSDPQESRDQAPNDNRQLQQLLQQQEEQQNHQQQQLAVTLPSRSEEVVAVDSTENLALFHVSTTQPQQQQQQQQASGDLGHQPTELPIPWDVLEAAVEIPITTSHRQIAQQEPFVTLQESCSSYLPDTTPSSRIPSLQPWPGQYSFSLSVPTDNKDKNKWCFSQLQGRLYLCPNVAAPVNVMLSTWVDASITITPVFKDSRFRMDPVTRCYNCKSSQVSDPDFAEHIVQVEGEGCEYGTLHERYFVTVPLQPPPPGEVASTLLLKLMCLTSCVGGPNRRPFCLVFTLRANGTGAEIGRQVLNVKCCKCPSRDMTNEDKGLSPQPGTAMPTLDEGIQSKVRKLASEIAVGQKRRKPNIKLEPGTPSGYVNVRVPIQFESEVKRYINTLIVKEFAKRTQPDLLLYPEEES